LSNLRLLLRLLLLVLCLVALVLIVGDHGACYKRGSDDTATAAGLD
jgi:hypothetical protein